MAMNFLNEIAKECLWKRMFPVRYKKESNRDIYYYNISKLYIHIHIYICNKNNNAIIIHKIYMLEIKIKILTI